MTNAFTPLAAVPRWIGADGLPADAARVLAGTPGGWTVVFLWQHACRGCHTHGFPLLVQLFDGLRGSGVRLLAVQAVFEEESENTVDRLAENAMRYALPIPFGHQPDAGRADGLLATLAAGGTPWFVLLDPDGAVVASHSLFDPRATIDFLRRAMAQQRAAASPSWREVQYWARHGNPPPSRRVELDEADWRRRLSPEAFAVLRGKGTERPYSSAMCGLFEPGRYACAGCGTVLFDAQTKFDSGSGWPSFTAPLGAGLVAYHADDSHGMQRIEVTCAVCDGHLGHVFPDGPPPTGLRYCINALSLEKEPIPMASHSETAILAGGCFWGMQELIRKLPGVLRTRVGYSGGDVPNATYRNHGTHAEAIEVVFDPAVFSYRQLLAFFFRIHDPTTLNRQGNDRGLSYRSGIYPLDDTQARIAREVIAEVDASGRWPGKVVTEVKPAGPFWEAEPEHQDYLQRYPDGYTCHWERPEWVLPGER